MTTALWVHGAGGHGRVVADVARSVGWDVQGFVVDGAPSDREVSGLPVEAWEEIALDRFAGLTVALGIGAGEARASSARRLWAAGATVATLVHGSAVISASACLDGGVVVMAGVVVNADA